MALETKLVQKLSQSLLMTPQLQQAIKLLQLGRLEYIQEIQKELLENPVLEEVRENEERQAAAASNENANNAKEDNQTPSKDNQDSPVAWEDYIAHFNDSSGASYQKGTIDFSERPSIEATMTKTESLHEYVASQVRHAEVQNEEQDIVLHIIGNLDRNGYLVVTHEEIARACSCSLEDVQRVVDNVIRPLDPPGVGARDLRECLLIQLENIGMGEGLAAKIVSAHLDKLEKRKYDQIAKVEEVAVEEVYQAVAAIRSLEPRPGRQFADEETRYIVPDIYVYKDEDTGEYIISLNEDGLPKLRVSSYYLDLLRNKDAQNVPNREYLTERLKAASWLIKSIHQRQHTIYKVTESIVKFQKAFFEEGIEKLKPLVLKDVAEDIGMHESTVSRVTTNKYVHTPQGVFELKYFFTSGIKTAEGEVSSSSIKEKIKAIIAAEDPKKPISDQKIVETLKEENITIARRTVAKYREALGILSSSKRKRLF